MGRSFAFTGACAALIGLTFAAAVPSMPPVHRYADDPPLAHTGGFGEPTCHACHFDGPLNADGGALTIAGVPDRYAPGQQYRVTVRLHRADLEAGGFELAARFADGTQAGTLRPTDAHADVSVVDTSNVAYAHHTPRGTAPVAADSARWTLEWTAPDARDSVVFHVAANAANDDASEFGDFIYTAQRTSNAEAGGQ